MYRPTHIFLAKTMPFTRHYASQASLVSQVEKKFRKKLATLTNPFQLAIKRTTLFPYFAVFPRSVGGGLKLERLSSKKSTVNRHF